jgi:hypothetical protein
MTATLDVIPCLFFWQQRSEDKNRDTDDVDRSINIGTGFYWEREMGEKIHHTFHKLKKNRKSWKEHC